MCAVPTLQRGSSVRVWGLTSWGRGPSRGGARAEGVHVDYAQCALNRHEKRLLIWRVVWFFVALFALSEVGYANEISVLGTTTLVFRNPEDLPPLQPGGERIPGRLATDFEVELKQPFTPSISGKHSHSQEGPIGSTVFTEFNVSIPRSRSGSSLSPGCSSGCTHEWPGGRSSRRRGSASDTRAGPGPSSRSSRAPSSRDRCHRRARPGPS